MLLDDGNLVTVKCVNGGGLNGECISDTFFIVQFFITFGLMSVLLGFIPIMIGVFICLSVRFCKNDKKRIRMSKSFELTTQTPLTSKRNNINSSSASSENNV